MSETDTSASAPTRKYNGWRTATMVLALLCIALAVGWYLRERQLGIDHDQQVQDYEIRISSLEKEMEGRAPASPEEDAEPISPATRPS